MNRAKDVLSPQLVSIPSDATVEEAIRTLVDHKLSGAPVVDDRMRLVGIISEYQLLEIIYSPEAKGHLVSQFMTEDVHTVDEDSLLTDVADLFILHRIRRVPVLRDDKTLAGVISRRDLLTHALKSGSATSPSADKVSICVK